MVNEVFSESYTGQEEISFLPNEFFINKRSKEDDGATEKLITDSCFSIISTDGTQKRYHIECETDPTSAILVRMFEYDMQIALRDATTEEYTISLFFPHSAVLALRHKKNLPDTMHIRIGASGSEVWYEYDVPVLKVHQYSLEKIFELKLMFLLPFYIFSHEKYFSEYEKDDGRLQKLLEKYRYILEKLNGLENDNTINAFTKSTICTMIIHVMELLARNYPKVREGVHTMMRGKIVEFPAKKVWDEGRNEGRNEGLEEAAREMLRDKVELSLVGKYTHLPLSRVKELAVEMGVL